MSTWDVLCDGGCPKPGGPGAYAFVIKEGARLQDMVEHFIPEGGITKVGKSGFRPEATNNTMEYAAVTSAGWFLLDTLQREWEHSLPTEIRFWGDSQLIVYQLTGRYKVNDPVLRPHYEEAKKFIDELRKHTKVSLNWFRREYNKEADELCNLQLEKHGVQLKKKRG